MSTVEMDQAAPESAAHHPLPDPGESVPRLALPTIGIFLATLTAFVGSTTAYISGWIPFWVTIPVNAAVTFVMFTVVHDASHYAISSIRWVNGLFGRLAWLFVGPVVAFPAFGYIHIQHHRHSNDDEQDPDTFASHGSLWVLPLRWSMVEYFYIKYYLPRGRSRPVIEVAETLVMMTLFLTGLIVAIVTGNFWTLAIVFLIPQRIGLTVLAWWFDWLPHHGLEDTQRSNRYRATRNRVGAEWLFTPVLLSQNYHLVHHLHPSVPFYRYLRTWRRNEEAYLERNAAISTVFGQQLNPDEYRQWKELNGRLARLLPVRMPARSSSPHAVLHRIPVASVDPITADATLVTFAVPEALRDAFRFEPGQHVTVRTDLGGQGIRRNYSICAPATRAQLRIAVKHIPGGAFSTFVANELKAGDVLELMTPTGRFGTPLDPLHRKHYVGLVAGSGITPVLSILATTLEIETESRFTLIYGNRTKESTMFRAELDRLESRYADRAARYRRRCAPGWLPRHRQPQPSRAAPIDPCARRCAAEAFDWRALTLRQALGLPTSRQAAPPPNCRPRRRGAATTATPRGRAGAPSAPHRPGRRRPGRLARRAVSWPAPEWPLRPTLPSPGRAMEVRPWPHPGITHRHPADSESHDATRRRPVVRFTLGANEGLQPLDNGDVGGAAALAHGLQPVAATDALQLAQHGGEQFGAGGA